MNKIKKVSVVLGMLVLMLSTKLFCGEPAAYDPRSHPSLLGEYNGETKRIKATSDGRLQVSVSDERFSNKVSTYTAGILTTSGEINVDFEVTKFSFLSIGGETQITSSIGDGIIYLPDKTGNETVLDVPKGNVSFNITVPNGVIVYYLISGIK